MAEKSSFLQYFKKENMGKAYVDAAEIKEEMAGIFLVLFQLKEQSETKVITRKFAQKDFEMLKLYLTLRKAATEEMLLKKSVWGCLLQLTDKLGLNEAERLVVLMALVLDGKEKLSLATAQKLCTFVSDLESQTWEAAREEKLVLFLESGNPLSLRASLRTHSQGETWGKQPEGIAGIFCDRVQTREGDKLEELVLYQELLAQMKHMAEHNRGDWTLQLRGDKGAGKQLLAAYLAQSMGRNLFVVDGKRLGDYKKETALYFGETNAKNWFFECVLLAVLSEDLVYLKNVGAADCRLLREFLSGLLLVAEEEEWEEKENGKENERERLFLPHMVTLELKPPTADEKASLWKAFLERFPHEKSINPYTLGGKYVLNAGEILEVLFAAQSYAGGLQRAEINSSDITWAIGQSQCGGLGRFAKPVDCVFDWEDLIVEDTVRKQMEYICAQMKYRHMVGSEWGFFDKMPYGRGLSVLFYGPPGTGKTMAAQVIAKELGLDLYRIDLSEMVSKYIGETEKNISQLFARARHMNVVLFFDEADAFFSKRSEVKDSHDRNANAEVAHLLQEMESYEGITILATNMKDNMDDAFKRRIKFMLKFSFPSVQTRIRLWHSLLPEKTPHQENLALDFFAEKFELSGSQIKDILLMAAFIAASDGSVLENGHIKEALRINYQKYGKLLTESDFDYLI